jgi:hypothetical protein
VSGKEHSQSRALPCPLTGSREELPFILLDETLHAGLQLFNIILLEEPHIALDSIIVVDSFFLHDTVIPLVPSNQHWHRNPPLELAVEPRKLLKLAEHRKLISIACTRAVCQDLNGSIAVA